MACTLPSTGACSLTADDVCAAPKVYNESLGLLVPDLVQGYDDHFDVQWTVDPLLTDQTVVMLYRERYTSNFEWPRIIVPHTDGVIESHTEDYNSLFGFGMRRETATEFGPTYRGIAICSADWTSDSVTVMYDNLIVVYGSETVIYD